MDTTAITWTVATMQDNTRKVWQSAGFGDCVSKFIVIFYEVFSIIGSLASNEHVPVLQYLLFS